MEKDQNGALQLALSIDVNEKTDTSASYTSLSALKIDASSHSFNVNSNQASKVSRDSIQADTGYVTCRPVVESSGGNALSSHANMLDIVTGCPPSGIKDNSDTSDRCKDSTLNGFTESPLQLMVGSAARGWGAEEPSPPCSAADVTDPQTEIDRTDIQGVSPQGEKNDCCPAEERDVPVFNSNVQCEAPLSQSCEGAQHQQNCPCEAAQPASLKLPNGDVDCIAQGALSSHAAAMQHVESSALDKEEKVANSEMLMVDNRAILNTDAMSLTPTVDAASEPSNPHVKRCHSPGGCARGSQEACPANPVQAQLQPNTHLSDGNESNSSGCLDHSSRNSCPTQKDDVGHGGGTEAGLTDLSPRPREPAARPQSLRTIPNTTHFLSCGSTPLSPEDGDTFLRTGAQQDFSFMDVSLNSRNTFEISRRQSAPDNIPGVLSVATVTASDQALTQKKPGITELFGRSLFSRKQSETRSAPGWKLFGKVPLRENTPKDSKTIKQDNNPGNLTSVSTPNLLNAGEYEVKMRKVGPCPSQPVQGRRKNLEFEPLSTTALILEDRPVNLPAKSEEEAQRHRQEYDEMVAEAKKREMKEAQRKKKQMKERFKQEEIIANAMVVWNTEILPNWESMRNTRRVRELWWQGLPPNVRGRVWSLAIGNELNITPELYEIFLSRAKERWRSFSETGSETDAEADSGASLADRESSLDLIKLDISRTFPPLFIFQKGGPYHDLLHSVLGAYTCYRPDVGYVQGMSFIAAVLILNLEEADAFIAFANLLNKPCQMAFFRVDHDLMLKYFAAFEVFFEENLPRLFSHFQSYSLTPDFYLIDWIFTLYTKSLPLDVACRVWDVFCRDGEEYLFRTGLGILRLYEEVLLRMDFIHIAQFLTRLPDNMAAERLFACIAQTQMVSGNRKWSQVFTALMKDNKETDKNTSPALKTWSCPASVS